MTNKKKSIALGTFDGIHIGHLRVLDYVAKSGFLPCAMLFSEHPEKYITGKSPFKLLADSDRNKILYDLGIKPLIVDFKELMELSPETFFYDVLLKKYNAGELSCGENYTFGKNGAGNTDYLKILCKKSGIKLNVSKMKTFEGKTVSSTAIRELILDGNMENAAKFLGRTFSYNFPVEKGDGRGHEIGFPTANQNIPKDFIKAKFGAYISETRIDGKLYPSITNVGIIPTFEVGRIRAETHVIGFNKDIYGKNIEVFLIHYERPEKNFKNLEDLKKSINAVNIRSSELFNKKYN
ncbi:MAG: bifunctional riboflavin kinase/FMN adenylyltransferase [Candidatus Fimenecus sp.]